MSLPLTLLLLRPPAPVATPPIFDQSIAAFKARKAFTVNIALDAMMNKSVTIARYRLSYLPPNKVLLTRLSNGQPNMVFWLNAGKFIAYDPASNEMTIRKAPSSGPIVNRLANALGGLEDPISAQLSPTTMAAFLSPFKSLQGWNTTTRRDKIILSRPGKMNGKNTLTSFEFSAASKLLTKALLIGPTSKLQWVFSYGTPPSTLGFRPPPGTRTVTALSEHARVNASDPRARNLVDKSLRAYSRVSRIAFTVSGSLGASDDWMSGSSFRERRGKVDWVYRGGVLTIKDLRTGRNYSGRCKPSSVLTYLKALGSPVEPVLQAFMTNKNPIRSWFQPDMSVSSRGSVTIGGVVTDAIELRSPTLEVSLLIRRDNNLVASVTSRTRDLNGNVISQAQRDFTYHSVNQPVPPTSLALQVTKPLPLSRIGK